MEQKFQPRVFHILAGYHNYRKMKSNVDNESNNSKLHKNNKRTKYGSVLKIDEKPKKSAVA